MTEKTNKKMSNGCESFYVAAGFKEDCMELISRFEKSGNLKFKSFYTIWNDMKFSLVLSGRATYSESIEFLEEALDIAKEFISPKESYTTKIGGIYLLYGLFFIMPVSQPKIRMVYSEWENVIKLRREIYQNKEYEAVYILKQLIDKNAFAHVCSEQEHGLENYYLLKDFMRGNPHNIIQTQRKKNEWTQIFDNIVNNKQIYLMKKQKLMKFSDHLAPKVYNIEVDTMLINEVKKLDNVNSNYSFSSSNQNSELVDPPSTSSDVNSYSHRIKLDSDNETSTSEESEDEDLYQ